MRLMDGTVEQGGIWGVRIDYWDEATSSFPPNSSYFFHDASLHLGKVRWWRLVLHRLSHSRIAMQTCTSLH